MSMPKQKPVLTSSYDLAGNAIERQIGHWIKIKTRIMGNYDSGPGLRCLLSLWVMHRFGKPLFMLRIWLKNQYGLKARLRRMKSRLLSRG